VTSGAIRYTSIFCSFLWPRHPGHSGGEIRDFHLLRHLLTQSEVEAFALHDSAPEGREDPLASRVRALHTPGTIRAAQANLHETLRPTLMGRLLSRARRAGLPVVGPRHHLDVELQLANAVSGSITALQAALEESRPDFLFVGPQLNPVALRLRHRHLPTRLVLASYDVESVRLERLADAARGVARLAGTLEARRALRFERENLSHYDGVIAVSDVDRDHFGERYSFPRERILVVENSVDPGYFAFQEREPGRPHEVLYVGSLAYWPNEQAAWRLIRRIMPRVRRIHPDARLTIVGQQPAARLSAAADGRTTVAGRVADVRPYLAEASVACVPLLAGSGTKYKVLESLSAGVPLVCSPVAVEGLDVRAGEHLLVGETDEEIADAIVRLLDEPRLGAALARRGRALVRERYAWDGNLPRIDGWLPLLAALPRRGAGPIRGATGAGGSIQR
jgi:glycosyltransferase involved in cell wall biosynthesis